MMAHVFTDFWNEEDGWDLDDTGLPGVILFAHAIQVWESCQDGNQTVAQAAAAFNVDEALIRRAVEAHSWMYLEGDVIMHKGE